MFNVGSVSTTTEHIRYASPLRYPGGKGSFAEVLIQFIEKNFSGELPAYAEPFAGGSGAALRLLFLGKVSRIFLNDADPRIYSFWRAVTTQNERFRERINNVALTIEEWNNQKLICSHPRKHSVFEVGFSTFYLNRCNRSGVIRGAGPIGGFDQKSRYKIDARFNREALAERVARIGELSASISVTNQDALAFLKTKIPKGKKRSEVFVYLDPPYVTQGRRLYMNYYDDADHGRLARFLKRQKILKWMVSYDVHECVKRLYEGCVFRDINAWYSLQNRAKQSELLVVPQYLAVPKILK